MKSRDRERERALATCWHSKHPVSRKKRVWLSLDQSLSMSFPPREWVQWQLWDPGELVFCAFPKKSSNLSWGFVKLKLLLNLRASQDKKIISQQRYPISGSFLFTLQCGCSASISLTRHQRATNNHSHESVVAGGTQTLLRWVSPGPHYPQEALMVAANFLTALLGQFWMAAGHKRPRKKEL